MQMCLHDKTEDNMLSKQSTKILTPYALVCGATEGENKCSYRGLGRPWGSSINKNKARNRENRLWCVIIQHGDHGNCNEQIQRILNVLMIKMTDI